VLGLATAVGTGRSGEVSAASRLEEVSVATEGNSVIVRLKTSGARRYHADLIDSPPRLVLDLQDTTYGWRKTPLVATSGPLVQVRGSQYRKSVARVVLELRSLVPYWIQDESDALIVILGAPRKTETRVPPAPVIVAAAAAQSSAAEPPPERSMPTPAIVAQVSPATPPAPPVTPAEPPAPTEPAPPAVPPAPATPPTVAPVLPAGERLISLEFKDADVVNLLRILAAESRRNIVMGDDVKGKMSISLRNVPWTLALQMILETRGLQRIDRDGVIRIVSTEQLAKEREQVAKERDARAKEEEAKVKAEEAKARAQAEIRTKAAEADLKEQEVQQRKRAAEAAVAEAIARGPLTEAAIRLSYADAGDVANTLQGLLGLEKLTEVKPCRGDDADEKGGLLRSAVVRGPIAEPPFSQLFGPPPQTPEPQPRPSPPIPSSLSITVHCATNSLFLRLHSTDLQRVRQLIRDSLDIPTPQVKIEARMEILERDDLFAIGVQWGGGGVLAVDNRNVIVGRGFTSDFATNPIAGGIPAAGLGSLSNPNLLIGTPGQGQVIPVSAQSGLPLGGNLVNLPIGALLQGLVPAGAGGITFGIIGSKLNINLALEALRAQGKTFTLARPDIVTLENRRARISLGEEIPYATVSSAGTQVQFKLAVLQLVVTPTVVRDATRNKIKMTVVVENNSRGATVNLGTSGSPPAINRRRAETEVVVNDGDHLVIGGVTTSVQREDIRKIPLLGDVPIFGWLFKQRGTQEARRELVVFITPSVLRTDVRPGPPPPAPLPPRPSQPPAK
jgi:type IV pilus secretin PilQ/predicted competence protein